MPRLRRFWVGLRTRRGEVQLHHPRLASPTRQPQRRESGPRRAHHRTGRRRRSDDVGALAVYDRRALTDDRSVLLLEVSVTATVIGWLLLTPRDGHRPDRNEVQDRLELLHGTALDLEWAVALPELPMEVHRVDLDPATDEDSCTGG